MACPICHQNAASGRPLADGTIAHQGCVESLEASHTRARLSAEDARQAASEMHRKLKAQKGLLGRLVAIFSPPALSLELLQVECQTAEATLASRKKVAASIESRLRSIYNFYLDYPPDWEERRAEVTARDKVCSGCGSAWDLHVHHLTPLAKGGTNRTDNLTLLCNACHTGAHHVQEFAGASNTSESAFSKRVRLLNDAISAGRDVEFLYRKFEETEFTRRVVTPTQLLNVPHRLDAGTTLSLRGYCHLREAQRTFALRRMRAVKLR